MKTEYEELCEKDKTLKDLKINRSIELQKLDITVREQANGVAHNTPKPVPTPTKTRQFQSQRKREPELQKTKEQLGKEITAENDKKIKDREKQLSRDPKNKEVYLEHLGQKRKEHKQSLEKTKSSPEQSQEKPKELTKAEKIEREKAAFRENKEMTRQREQSLQRDGRQK